MLSVVAKMVGAIRGDTGMCYWLDGVEWNPLKYTECSVHMAAVLGLNIHLRGMISPFPICCVSWCGDMEIYHEEEATYSGDLAAVNRAIVKCAYKVWEYQNSSICEQSL